MNFNVLHNKKSKYVEKLLRDKADLTEHNIEFKMLL